jgi:hypothetical protein
MVYIVYTAVYIKIERYLLHFLRYNTSGLTNFCCIVRYDVVSVKSR